ncbi:MAG: hypothetical protein UR28_C0019G0034 [Candidatus Peregrinibacteria bacterium GW2011_GWF2_33_10]|nr:MAG: hypothetical protein UR28_C0019G0034 [Candidatus Peregrinibacteria bacterium GW2011_GWF2_33_10]OGJ43997.1 MAG: hypothetical protein A2272_05185 [Candidatus Peregrinibacteria bacterium RIFOXYA12_FULL_33_12]
MSKTILSENQKLIVSCISKNKEITDCFYFGGGTVLAEYYLHHRYSEDLDFFSTKEFESESIYIFFKNISKKCKILKIDFKQSFNRNLFFLYLDNDIIKTEFTYFPFENIEKCKTINNIKINSLLDIAVNKVFTIYQNPRSRDFIDLFFIIKEKKWNIDDLIKKAKIKFDWHIDYIQLGSQFTKILELKDYPRMIKKINMQEIENYFLNLAKKFSSKILK